MAQIQSPASISWVRQRRGDHDVLTAPLVEPGATALAARSHAVRRDSGIDVALLVEITCVAAVVTGAGWLTRGPSLTVAAVLALVLVTLYHSGRQVTRQGLPHLGRITRDMAIPVALMAFAAELYAPGRGVIQDSIQMVAAGTATAVVATIVRRQISGRVKVVVVGDAEAIARSATTWAGSRRVEVVGAIRLPDADGDTQDDVELFGVPVVAGIEDAAAHVADWNAELAVVVAGRAINSGVIRRLTWELEDSGATLALLSDLDFVAPHRIETTQFAGTTLIHVAPGRQSVFVRLVKGAIDRVVGAVLFLLAAPLIALLMLLVKIESRGPGLHRQVRVGQDGRPFTMYKIRSMCVGAEEQKGDLIALNERDGALFKMRRDPRVTRVGAFLRKASLDELPQLFNVVRGDMSLIGPRPALPDEVSQYDDVARRRLAVRPGLTGLSQVNGRSDLTFDHTIQLDLRYTDNWRLADDLAIGARTVRAVISSKGAY